jgi:hypothetical protein
MTEDTLVRPPPLAAGSTGAPKIGFVSLGCPKALTDSELILTRLSPRATPPRRPSPVPTW